MVSLKAIRCQPQLALLSIHMMENAFGSRGVTLVSMGQSLLEQPGAAGFVCCFL